MIRTFSPSMRYYGTPRLNEKIYDYPYFIGDRIFSKIVSAYYEDLIDYLKHCEFNPSVCIAITSGVIVPKINITLELVSSNKNKFIEFIKIIMDNFNWEVAAIQINDKSINNFKLVDLYIYSYPARSIIELDIKPKSFDSTKLRKTNPEFDYDKYNENIYLFHITDKSRVSSILEKGLLPRDSEYGDFKYKSLVHLLRFLGGNLVKYINKKLYVTKGLRINNPALLKIGPLKSMSTEFLIDPSDPVEGLITSERIDSKYIEEVPENQLAKYFKDYKIPTESKIVRYLNL